MVTIWNVSVARIYKLPYERMVEDALRRVIREALLITEQQGLPGTHHFYITFRTRYPGVIIARHLLERHPDEMTIVLQNQFWGLEVDETSFVVTLSFNRVSERLRIPFAAVTAFTDPTAKFGLQFNVDSSLEQPLPELLPNKPHGEDQEVASSEKDSASYNPDQEKAKGRVSSSITGNVITLDAFRKKK